jgi:hypothetical protein
VRGAAGGEATSAVVARRDGRWAGAAIALTIAFAVAVSVSRARAGTVDFWYDDSWIAISTRVPLSSVARVGVSAPGFTFVIRWWMGLRPGSIAWAQSFALLGLVASVVAVFVAARVAGAARWAATTAACLTALNPMLLAESARVKQYTWEFAFSAAIVAVAAAIRRDGPTLRWTASAGALVVVAVIFSGSMLIPGAMVFVIIVVALWTAVHRAGDPLPVRAAFVRVALLTLAGAIVLVWAAVYLLDPPAALATWWRDRDGFLGSGGSLKHTARQAFEMLRGFWAEFVFGGGTPLLIVPVVALAWSAWRRWRTDWWLLLAPGFAIVLSATQRYPLGTVGRGRIDAWLMPWVAVFLALTLTEIAAVSRVRALVGRASNPMKAAVVGLVAVALAAVAWEHTTHYPTVRARDAVATLARVQRRRGLTYIVNGDFPVAVLAPGQIRIVDDPRSTTGWSVAFRGGPRTLHLNDPARAARELRPACGKTAVIAGAYAKTIARVLPRVGCPVQRERTRRYGTSDPHDDTVVVTFGPR